METQGLFEKHDLAPQKLEMLRPANRHLMKELEGSRLFEQEQRVRRSLRAMGS